MLQDQSEMEDRGMESGENMMSPCSRPLMDRRVKPQTEQDLKCPRCDSTNTKFCYYNNYSLTQPRHFCKTCRRYWTKGGSLRSVPVGGGCRKNNKRTNNNNNKRNGDQPCSTSSATAEGSTVPVTGHDLSPNPSFGAAANNYMYYNEAAAAEELGINYGRSLSLGESAYVGGEFGQGFQSCIPTNLTNLQSLQYSNFLGAASTDHGFSRQPVNRLGAMNIADLSSIIDSKPLTSNTPFEGDVSHPYINNSNSNIGLDHTTGQSHSHSRLLMQQHQKNNSYEEGSQGLYEGGYWNPGAWPDLSAYGLPNVNNSM